MPTKDNSQKDSSQADKVIWLWLLRPGANLKVNSSLLLPSQSNLVWDYVFARNSAGAYVRAERALNALRLRSLAHRKAGVKACANTAMLELALQLS